MSNSLKQFFLFTGLHLTVKEVGHQRNLDRKSDLSLGDLKKQKKNRKFYKKRALKQSIGDK